MEVLLDGSLDTYQVSKEILVAWPLVHKVICVIWNILIMSTNFVSHLQKSTK